MNLKTGRRKGNKFVRMARARLNQVPLPGRQRAHADEKTGTSPAANAHGERSYPAW